MILIFFSATLIACSYSFFSVVTRLQCVNRIIANTPIDIFEKSIPLIDDETDLHFDKDKLYYSLNEYYSNNLRKYINSYHLELYYYNQIDQSICTDDNCNAVEVDVSGTSVFSFRFHRTLTYEIHKGAQYGI